MIDCLIVDDEAPARRHLVRLLHEHPDVRVSGEAMNGLEALQRIGDHPPAVVFLDVEMPGLNGFEVLQQLAAPPVVVFVTAYDQYAVKAFGANAIDYILKPVTAARLDQAMTKVRTSLTRPYDAYVAALRATLAHVQSRPVAKLAGQRGKRVVLVAPEEVLYAVAEDKLVFLCTSRERLLINRTIAELEELLCPRGFIRTSRSVLLNLEHARELVPWSSGTWKVKLSNGTEVGVSRERARDLKARVR